MATVKETRKVFGFSTVVMRGYGDLEIEQHHGQAGQENLTIEADEQVMPRILAEVRGDRLVLGFSMPWYDWLWWWWQWLFTADKRIRFRLTSTGVESLKITGAGLVSSECFEAGRLELSVSGAGRIRLAGIAAKDMETRLSGAADVELAGTADRHDVRLSGAGSVHAHRLDTKRTTVVISGAGSCSVDVSDELDVRISGAGSVSYAGNPRVTQRVSGAGSVRQAS
ncbi:MAG: DUF2807 domain-containing protein [Spirochaetes bacterium]|nr:DUF2807 domain-containing protein [Spirochaetota bacterium]